MRRIIGTTALSALLLGASATGAVAVPLPDNCAEKRGTVTCTTVEDPGRNRAGIGTTTAEEAQGSTTTTSPDPQELESTCEAGPAQSPGAPNTCS